MKAHEYLPFFIGQKIELGQTRFVEDEVDRVFTLGGVTTTKFYIDELECWYDIQEDSNNISHDKLLLEPLTEIDLKNISAEEFLQLAKEGYDVFSLIKSKQAVDSNKINEKISKYLKFQFLEKETRKVKEEYLKLEDDI